MMKPGEIKKVKLEDLYWRLVYGKSGRRAVFLDLLNNNFRDLPAPVFFLSTGRCGTNWFTHLLSKDKSVKAFHEPKPNFGVQGKTVYEIFVDAGYQPKDNEIQLIGEMFLAGREQILRYSYKTGRRYIETNNQLTFFAPVLAKMFPNALFVHLNRHPGEFVRSAIRRNFYSNNIEDLKRIIPTSGSPMSEGWTAKSQIYKNAWLWNETNLFIEKFKTAVPEERCFYFNFNDLTVKHVAELTRFLNVNIDERKIGSLLGEKRNVQKKGDFAFYDNWTEEDKSDLKDICGELATRYGYNL